MKDFKFESPFITINPKNNRKFNEPKCKAFGYQILGFGSGVSAAETFICASGGNTTATSGDYKIHTFTGPGTFTVCSVSEETPGNNVVSYLVVAGGGGGGGDGSGGGGAGGYREGKHPGDPAHSASPLAACCSTLPVAASPGSYPITVGAGGPGNPNLTAPGIYGVQGSSSVFSTITSAGGGYSYINAGGDGGSGGGGGRSGSGGSGGSGDTPDTTPDQGTDGGNGTAPGSPGGGPQGGGGGGGATVAGTNAPSSPPAGAGGAGGTGATTSINASETVYAGGGGGGSTPSPGTKGAGGSGGGGAGAGCGAGNDAVAGTANTGGGGGGSTGGPVVPGGAGPTYTPMSGFAGGSGIVIIRYKYQ